MKNRIFAAILAISAVGVPLLASADDMSATTASTQTQADNGSGTTTLNCQWTPGNEDKGGNWGCADKDHSKSQ